MNDEAVIKLAQLESKFDSISEIVSRIERVMERAVQRFEASDGAVRELVVQNQHTQERLAELRRANEACSEAHKAANDALGQRVAATQSKADELATKATTSVRIVMWFCGGFSTLALLVGAWAFGQISKNTEINGLQQQRIERLERELGDARADVRELLRPAK